MFVCVSQSYFFIPTVLIIIELCTFSKELRYNDQGWRNQGGGKAPQIFRVELWSLWSYFRIVLLLPFIPTHGEEWSTRLQTFGKESSYNGQGNKHLWSYFIPMVKKEDYQLHVLGGESIINKLANQYLWSHFMPMVKNALDCLHTLGVELSYNGWTKRILQLCDSASYPW